MEIDLGDDLLTFVEYARPQGRTLQVAATEGNRRWLCEHWRPHRVDARA
jgi:hypothetical protein